MKGAVSLTKCIVAFGANLGDREQSFQKVLEQVQSRVGSIEKRSKLYETTALLHPHNPEPQPNFLNAVFSVMTELGPTQVLSELLSIEEALGRERNGDDKPWSARSVDLDLIAYGDLILETPTLTLPHKQMHVRDFVLVPLKDIEPKWRHPKQDMTVEQMLAMLTDKNVL